MDLKQLSEEAVTKNEEQKQELKSILKKVTQDHNFDIARERLIRWKERTVRIISEEIKEGEGQRFEVERKGAYQIGAPLINFTKEVESSLFHKV